MSDEKFWPESLLAQDLSRLRAENEWLRRMIEIRQQLAEGKPVFIEPRYVSEDEVREMYGDLP